MMESQDYHELLNALLQAQDVDELLALAQQHPELLSEEFQGYVQQQLALFRLMNPQAAAEIDEVEHEISARLQLLQMIEELAQADALTEGMPAIPDHIPPSADPRVAWAKPFREYIALVGRNDAPLQEALQRAQQAGENEIVALLSQLAQGQSDDAAEQASRLFLQLQQQGRLEEAYSLLLLPIVMRAALAELFRQFPVEHQMAALQVGLEACEAGYRLAQALSDEPCQALFLGVKGGGLREARQLEAAVGAYEQALAIYRRLAQAQPQVYEPDVAMTLNNLGNALSELRRLEAAVGAYQEALEIYNRHDIPDQKAKTLANLGKLYIGERRYEDALPYLRAAADLVERLRAEGLSPARRRQNMAEYLGIYENLLICLMRLELYDEALVVAERGRSRLLLDLLTAQELRPKNAPEHLARRYEELLFRARALADALERPDPPDLPPDARAERIVQLRQERQQVSRELGEVCVEINRYDPNFLPAAQPLTREQILQLAQAAQTTILSLRVTVEGSYAFLVYPDGDSEAVVISDFTLERLWELAVKGWAVDYYTDRERIRKRLLNRIQDGKWHQQMEARLGALYQELLSPVHQRLRAKLGAGVHPLLIVPNRALALLPLHACGWDEDGGAALPDGRVRGSLRAEPDAVSDTVGSGARASGAAAGGCQPDGRLAVCRERVRAD
jgi:tetratricopeptide (TPR) repeat protein